jgi:hypothetical protein
MMNEKNVINGRLVVIQDADTWRMPVNETRSYPVDDTFGGYAVLDVKWAKQNRELLLNQYGVYLDDQELLAVLPSGCDYDEAVRRCYTAFSDVYCED